MVVYVEVAACHELEIEAGVEGEERQQVVEKPDPGLDARPPLPSSATEGGAPSPSSFATPSPPVPAQARARLRAHGGDVILGRAADGDTDALRERAHDDSLRLEPLRERLVGSNEDEVRRRRLAVVAGGGESARSRSRSAMVASTSPRRGAQAAAPIAAAGPEIGAGARRSVRSADVSGCANAKPTRSAARPNAFESVRTTTRFGNWSTHRAADRAPYSTYASSTTTIVFGLRSGERDDLLGLHPRAGRVVEVAEPAEVGVFGWPRHVGTVQRRRDPVERVRRRVDRRPRARPEKRLSQQKDQVVRARADDDVLGRQPGIRRSDLAERAVCPVRVLVEPRHALGERHLRHARQRRRVLVELENGLARDAVALGDLVGRRGPDVRREPVADRLGLLARDAHPATAAACSGKPLDPRQRRDHLGRAARTSWSR